MRRELTYPALTLGSLISGLVLLFRTGAFTVDTLLTAVVAYLFVVTAFIEGRLYWPGRLREIVERRPIVGRLLLFLYIPSAVMMFWVGYRLGMAFMFLDVLRTLIFSALIGLIVFVSVIIINDILTQFLGRGERK